MFNPSGKQKSLNKQLRKAACKGRLEDMQRLLEEGADINASNKYNDPPLFNAAHYGHIECVRFLLQKGAKVDVMAPFGCTPLMGAAERGYVDIVHLLLAAGADPALRARGQTAANWAIMNNHEGAAKILRQVMQPTPVENPNEIVFQHQLGNRILQEVFNFEVLERISLVRKDADSAVEAITRDSFSTLTDQSQLRKAFEEHVRRGGKADESRVFPYVLSKPKPPQQK
ncbi:MAG: ankyrin repeat domain-containing protein [Proteobacteria bacterium]|nr:ankyrin repeat domain-containing protein [Pseudomonadota bacterium]